MTTSGTGRLRVGIVGCGAVGTALASCLHEAGAALRLVARGADARALRERGPGRTGLFGEHRAPPEAVAVDESVSAWRGRALDFVLVCTKTPASREVAAALAGVWETLDADPRAVLFHNGWGSAALFADALPADRVLSARVITGFRRTQPATSEVTVHADAVRIGALHGADPADAAPLARALSKGGLPAEVAPRVERELLAKLLYNCALNPLGALCRVPYGALAERSAPRGVLEAVVAECFAVFAAAGLEVEWEGPDDYLRDFYARILPPTAEHESSMLQDLRAGRPTEIDFLSGAVAKLGRRHGVATPVNAALWTLVRGSGG